MYREACFYLKHGGDLPVKIIEKKRFSQSINQEGMELPGTCIYRSADTDTQIKLLILDGEAMEGLNKANSKAKSELSTKQRKNKDTSRKQNLYLLNIFQRKTLWRKT